MPKYRITSDNDELPRGSRVYLIPVISVQPGQLAMFELRNDPNFLITGRWHPNVGILQPGRLIRDTKTVSIRILGVVIPIESNPKEITNLNTAEYVHALLNAREVKG